MTKWSSGGIVAWLEKSQKATESAKESSGRPGPGHRIKCNRPRQESFLYMIARAGCKRGRTQFKALS
jgi:hypothetical protein